MLQSIVKRIVRLFRFYSLLIYAKIFGIAAIVAYLRNPDPAVSVKILRAFGAKIGQKVTFKRSVFFDNVFEDQDSVGDFSNLTIGDNCYIGDGVYFDLARPVVFEDNVVISGHVSFVTHADCNRSPGLSAQFARKSGRIIVKTGAWIGFGATVLHGVTIANNSVIAAHSLQKNSTLPYTVNAGLPSKQLKEIPSESK